MDPDYKKFGRGPRELTGAVDLISHYRLFPHHDFFCKRSLPVSISDTYYLHNVVGDTELRKGEGMQLGQLIQDASLSKEANTRIRPFNLDILSEAFQLRETAPVDLPSLEKGTPTIAGKSRSDSKDKEKKHKKSKDKERDKDKEHKKHKHRHKDRSKEKDKEKKKEKMGIMRRKGSMTGMRMPTAFRNTRKVSYASYTLTFVQHKSLKIDGMGAMKAAG
ncbi:UNVERIFIED_CONTAM: Mediator of RNA polymerase II transcription subunita [Sesamum angustifolium]|uniref:Mediator of RNA polymerase II transcription subunita n=1 Tax=Sesamum angustifolium TaxID=2727405 RepID=A0AAW2QSL3_9LAMI